MEEVLDVYAQPYDADNPVICMDEQPVQLVKETRPSLPATKTQSERIDYEYERAGTASIFMFTEPLAGWRQATVRQRRTKSDWALEVAALLEGRYYIELLKNEIIEGVKIHLVRIPFVPVQKSNSLKSKNNGWKK